MRVGGGASEQDRGHPPRKGHRPKSSQSSKRIRCYGPEQFLTLQHCKYHVASKLCLISQTILLFHSWLPLLGFIDSFAFCLLYRIDGWFLSLFCIFLLVLAIPLESVMLFLSPQWCVRSCSQSPVTVTDALLTSPSR